MERIIRLPVAIIMIMLFVVALPNAWSRSVKPNPEGTIDLIEKDIWGNVLSNGAFGKLKFTLEGSNFDFSFIGSRLVPSTTYALIRSLEPQAILPYYFDILKEGTSDSLGLLNISGFYNLDDDLITGEFLLVPVNMLNLRTDGRPSASGRYLSGQGLIGYNDTDTNLKCGCKASGTDFTNVGIPIGNKAVDFTLETTDGEAFGLYDYLKNGKPVVLITGAYT